MQIVANKQVMARSVSDYLSDLDASARITAFLFGSDGWEPRPRAT